MSTIKNNPGYRLQASSFSPIIERIRVVMKKILQNVAGSLKNTIPTITAPTAPMPVQTG